MLLKLAGDGEIDDATRGAMERIVRDYTGTSMTEMMRVIRDGIGVCDTLEGKLVDENGQNGVQLSFDEGVEEMSG